MSNIYVWMHASSEECTTESSTILFIGKESDCVDYCKNLTYDSIRKEVRKSVDFFSRLKVKHIKLRITAGVGETRTEKTFRVRINYGRA